MSLLLGVGPLVVVMEEEEEKLKHKGQEKEILKVQNYAT